MVVEEEKVEGEKVVADLFLPFGLVEVSGIGADD